MKTFGERLKQLRLEMGMSGAELGEKFGMSRSGISNWEARNREPSLEMLVKLSKLFDVTVDYLIGISDERRPSGVKSRYVSVNLIKQLIENKSISDADNIPDEIVEMIILALKNDLKASKKN